MPYRSLFHRSLDVLTCIWNKETDINTICERTKLGPVHVSELLEKLTEWRLLEADPEPMHVTEQGKSVLSFYHKYPRDLKVKPKVKAKAPEH